MVRKEVVCDHREWTPFTGLDSMERGMQRLFEGIGCFVLPVAADTEHLNEGGLQQGRARGARAEAAKGETEESRNREEVSATTRSPNGRPGDLSAGGS